MSPPIGRKCDLKLFCTNAATVLIILSGYYFYICQFQRCSPRNTALTYSLVWTCLVGIFWVIKTITGVSHLHRGGFLEYLHTGVHIEKAHQWAKKYNSGDIKNETE